jgi:hypothetical protein
MAYSSSGSMFSWWDRENRMARKIRTGSYHNELSAGMVVLSTRFATSSRPCKRLNPR